MANPTVELLDELSKWVGNGEKVSDYHLAKHYFDLSPANINGWRKGKRQFSSDYVCRICEDIWPGNEIARQHWLLRVTAHNEKNVHARAAFEKLAKQAATFTLVAVLGLPPLVYAPPAGAISRAHSADSIYIMRKL